MHELGIAQGVVRTVEEAAREEGAHKVLLVRLVVGEAAGVMIDSLRFCFDAVSRGSLAEGATLEIKEVPRRGRCSSCGYEGLIPPSNPCPSCGGYGVQTLEGQQLLVKEIDVD